MLADAIRADLAGDTAQAERLYRSLVEADAGHAEARRRLGELLQKLGRLDEARVMLTAALRLEPGSAHARYLLATVLLARGDYPAGWTLYEARRDAQNLLVPELDLAEWRGEPLAGKRILLFLEQGLGDTIQFCRFALTLRDQGARVVMLCWPPLRDLFAGCLDGVEVLALEGDVQLGDPDYWTMLGSLPGLLGVTFDTIPGAPYLHALSAPRATRGPPRVGLATRGNPRHSNDTRRSLQPADAARLHALAGVEIVSLHPEDAGDFVETARIVAGLDLVIAVDSAIGHLAGAMGKPTLLLVPGFATDWRWLRGREDSPWYPNHRLFRNGLDGDWTATLDRVENAVAELVRQHRPVASEPVIEEFRQAFERGMTAQAAGDFGEAERLYRLAVEHDPSRIEPRLNLGVLLRMLARPGEARDVLEAARALAPDRAEVRSALGLVLLTLGDYAAGWPLYEARREVAGARIMAPRLPIPEWDGQSPAGKRIVVFPEQGLGDNILFSRFVLDLRDRDAQVLLLARPPLASLMAASFDGVEVQAATGQLDLGSADAWVLVASLPGKLGVTLDTLSGAPYLRGPPAAPRPGGPFRIGLAVSGNPLNLNDARRNLPPDAAARLRAIPGVEVVSLLPQDTGARDFSDTAAIIAGLDLVVSVDTAIAHLAGALGAPTVIMLPGYAADWRYLTGREDSPWYAGARLLRGTVDGDWSAALERLEAWIARAMADKAASPPWESAEQLFQMGVTAHKDSRFADAEQLYRRAIAADPALAGPRHYLGLILRALGRLEEARDMLSAALDLDPQSAALRHALGVVLLNLGDYAAGWPLYEARLERPAATPALETPQWRGEPLAGKRIAVFPEQGLGDALQFVRFIPLLRDLGARVLLLCRTSLVDLFAASLDGVEVAAAAGDVDLGDLDYWTMQMSLPYRLGLTLQSLPTAPYLKARDPQPRQLGKLRVGLLLQGNPRQENDARRSLSAEQAARLRALPGIEIVSLQPEDAGGFVDTANIIAGLDLVISVDSAIGHLAGAMGKPTFLLTPGFGADWRWLTDRADSPWYPNHRLFRAGPDGDWNKAFDQVEAAVGELTQGPPPPT